MKKESIGFTLSLMLLFGGYIFIQNYYIKKQQSSLNLQQSNTHSEASTSINSSQQSKPNEPPISSNQSPNEPTAAVLTPPKNEEQAQIITNPEELIIDVPYAHFKFTQQGGCLGKNFLTREYATYNSPELVSVIENYNICKAFGFKVGELDLRSENAIFIKKIPNTIHILQKTPAIEISRSFKFSDANYTGEFQIEVKNISGQTVNTSVDFELGATSDNKQAGGVFSLTPPQYHGVSIRLSDGTVKREYTPFESNPERKVILNINSVVPTWLNVDSLYWMNTLIPQFHTPLDFEVTRTGYNLKKNPTSEIDQTVYEAWVKQPIHLNPGQTQNFSYKIYFGPKNETILKQFQHENLNETIDYGFFKIVARPLYYVLDFIHDIVKNWGVSIIILTIIINLIFMPLQIKGYISAQKMQAIQPQIKALQEKYKDDKQKIHQETMALMAKSGVNPLSGCLPLLPQIPVFFGLNSTLQHTFDLRQSPFFFWIHDLTRHDPYFVLPIIMALLMLGYQKMMPMPSMDPMQAKMMKFLPILFSIFMVVYPSGLALYVITNTIISMVRQTFLMRRFKNN